jgi:tRNA threonylcarbamoyladenosine biosynthesis protein TsaB
VILCIETSTNVCSAAIFSDSQLLGSAQFDLPKSHATLIPTIFSQLLDNIGATRSDLTAIAVSGGPGSYTGLRIGVTAAKALSYTLSIPLICVPTLNLLIDSVVDYYQDDQACFIPMIDARRMEVYTKVLRADKKELLSIRPLILEANSLDFLSDYNLILIGDGSAKCRDMLSHDSYIVLDHVQPNAACMGRISSQKFLLGDFVDIAYFEPLYLKEFQTKKSKDLLRP